MSPTHTLGLIYTLHHVHLHLLIDQVIAADPDTDSNASWNKDTKRIIQPIALLSDYWIVTC
jgi:hypothetical protein